MAGRTWAERPRGALRSKSVLIKSAEGRAEFMSGPANSAAAMSKEPRPIQLLPQFAAPSDSIGRFVALARCIYLPPGRVAEDLVAVLTNLFSRVHREVHEDAGGG